MQVIIRAIILIVAVYSATIYFSDLIEIEQESSLWLILIAVVGVVSLANIPFYFISNRRIKEGKDSLRKSSVVALLIKILLIPAFLYVGAILLFIQGWMAFISGPFAALLTPVYTVAGMIVLIASSSFSVPVINNLYHSGRITGLQRVINIALQFVLVIDVFSFIYIMICGKVNTSKEGLADGRLAGDNMIRSGVTIRAMLLVATLYPILLIYFGEIIGIPPTVEAMLIVIGLNFVMIIICLAFSYSTYRKVSTNRSQMPFLRNAALWLKVILTPYYVINFAVWMLSIFGDLEMVDLFIGIMAMIVAGHTFLILLASASFSIPAIIILMQENKITKPMTILYIVLQFFFVLDTVSYVILCIKTKRTKENEVTVC